MRAAASSRFAIVAWSVCLSYGQTPSLPASFQTVVGTITYIEIQTGTLRIKTDQNQDVLASVRPGATIRKAAAGETDLKKAVTVTLAEIGLGDRVAARGIVEGAILQVTSLLTMSKGDLTAKQQADQADWEKRGVSGIVSSVKGNDITAKIQDRSGSRSMTITLAAGGVVRRYAPNSVRFADAVPSRIDAILAGDQIRARGESSADGLNMTAAEIVSGTFRNIAGLVQEVNAAAGELRIRDLDSKRILSVQIDPGSRLQKPTPQIAQQVAGQLRPGTSPKGNSANAAATPQQLLESSPTITLTDLRAGDAVVISCAGGEAGSKVTAISLFAGVEPILTKPGTQEMSIGSWNLAVGAGAP